ncbi:MAG: HmuY family protein [Flavobacteriales bacterium]|nr:HmuY family protein [Flavobacteriales bacterium]
MKKLIPFLLLVVLFSCKKEDDKYGEILDGEINLNEEYGPRINQVSMGSEYTYQAYFDLNDNEAKANVSKYLWDIGLVNDSPFVVMNQSISGLRIALSPNDWSSTNASTSAEMGYDMIGERDYYIGSNFAENVYILDRGVDETAQPLGMKKFMVVFDNGQYTVTSADMNGSNEVVQTFDVNGDYNFQHVNLVDGVHSVEPSKEDWDIVFTHYLHIFDPETAPFPYQVTGCLVNSHGVTVAEALEHSYDEVDYEIASTYERTNDIDEIGYDWKYYDFDLGFITDDTRTFIVEDVEGNLFKIKFTSFYNEDGDKGNPQFEYQKLQP